MQGGGGFQGEQPPPPPPPLRLGTIAASHSSTCLLQAPAFATRADLGRSPNLQVDFATGEGLAECLEALAAGGRRLVAVVNCAAVSQVGAEARAGWCRPVLTPTVLVPASAPGCSTHHHTAACNCRCWPSPCAVRQPAACEADPAAAAAVNVPTRLLDALERHKCGCGGGRAGPAGRKAMCSGHGPDARGTRPHRRAFHPQQPATGSSAGATRC